ncbi:MAG: dienelactone hydrolase family protein [Phycisphaerales bacterium]|nr:dienelactone hydrolase family protein [Phycisphaerales bacterium]
MNSRFDFRIRRTCLQGTWAVLLGATSAWNAQGVFAGPTGEAEHFERGSVAIEVDGETHRYPYRLHRPQGLSEGDLAPLVVFLHGSGERGTDNQAQLRHFPERFVREPHLTKHDAFLLAVQCPQDDAWVTIEDRWKGQPDFSRPTAAIKGVEAAIRKLLEEEPIHSDRVYLTGLSMGGFGAWDLAARHPDWFAAVVPICGGAVTDNADRFVDLPVWAFHGDADAVVPERQSRAMIDAIRAAGGRPAYTVLPGIGHDSWRVAYGPEGAMNWMFAQVRTDGTPAPGDNPRP